MGHPARVESGHPFGARERLRLDFRDGANGEHEHGILFCMYHGEAVRACSSAYRLRSRATKSRTDASKSAIAGGIREARFPVLQRGVAKVPMRERIEFPE